MVYYFTLQNGGFKALKFVFIPWKTQVISTSTVLLQDICGTVVKNCLPLRRHFLWVNSGSDALNVTGLYCWPWNFIVRSNRGSVTLYAVGFTELWTRTPVCKLFINNSDMHVSKDNNNKNVLNTKKHWMNLRTEDKNSKNFLVVEFIGTAWNCIQNLVKLQNLLVKF